MTWGTLLTIYAVLGFAFGCWIAHSIHNGKRYLRIGSFWALMFMIGGGMFALFLVGVMKLFTTSIF